MTDFDPNKKFAARFAYKMAQLSGEIERREAELESIRASQASLKTQLECSHTWTSEEKMGQIILYRCTTCEAVVIEERGAVPFQ